MGMIIIIFSFLVAIYTLGKYRTTLHPLFIFNIIWLVIFGLDYLSLYNLLHAENRFYNYMFIGIATFDMGYILWTNFRRNKRIVISPLGNFNHKGDYEVRYNVLYILAGICILYYISDAFLTVRTLLAGNSMSFVRSAVQSNNASYSSTLGKIINAISVLLLVPGSSVIQVIGAFDYWTNKDKRLFVLGAVLAVLSSVGEGGRTSIANFLFYMLIGYSIFGNNGRLSDFIKKRKRMINMIVIVTILFLAWFSVSRAGQLIYKNLYLCFSMQPYMFSFWGKMAEANNVIGYGEASLNGFGFAILYVFKNIFSLDFPSHWKTVYDLIRATDSQWQIITSTATKANAYVSCFWFFYVDGRVAGIVIGMFLYGLYVAHTYAEMVKNMNRKTLCIYAFVFQGLIWCFIRFSFSNIYYAMAYLMIAFVAFKRKTRNEGR